MVTKTAAHLSQARSISPSIFLTKHPSSRTPALPSPIPKAIAPPLSIAHSPSPMSMTPTLSPRPLPSAAATSPLRMYSRSPTPMASPDHGIAVPACSHSRAVPPRPTMSWRLRALPIKTPTQMTQRMAIARSLGWLTMVTPTLLALHQPSP